MILHIVLESEWNRAKAIEEYRHASLEREGFIHFSKPDQVVRIANFKFKGQAGLILLIVDEARLKAQLKFEGESPTDLFPHLYGPSNLDAVVGTVEALIRSTADSSSKSYYQIKGMLPVEGGEIQEAKKNQRPKPKSLLVNMA